MPSGSASLPSSFPFMLILSSADVLLLPLGITTT